MWVIKNQSTLEKFKKSFFFLVILGCFTTNSFMILAEDPRYNSFTIHSLKEVGGELLKIDSDMKIYISDVHVRYIQPFVLKVDLKINHFANKKYFVINFYSKNSKYPPEKNLRSYVDSKRGIAPAIMIYFETLDKKQKQKIVPVLYKKGRRTQKEGKIENLFFNDFSSIRNMQGRPVGAPGSAMTYFIRMFGGFGLTQVDKVYGYLYPDQKKQYHFLIYLNPSNKNHLQWNLLFGFVSTDFDEKKRGLRNIIILPPVSIVK